LTAGALAQRGQFDHAFADGKDTISHDRLRGR
jgi:hypothetical protein